MSTDATFDFSDTPEDETPAAILNEDFSLEDEYKPEPLVPQGNYFANVIGVTVDAKSKALVWNICLDGNGGMQSDGETPIDGKHVWYRNWLPRQGDDQEMIKTGTMTKRQSKINMLKRFADDMKISIDTPAKIIESVEEGLWVGLRVIAAVGINEYMGITRNEVNKMVLADKD